MTDSTVHTSYTHQAYNTQDAAHVVGTSWATNRHCHVPSTCRQTRTTVSSSKGLGEPSGERGERAEPSGELSVDLGVPSGERGVPMGVPSVELGAERDEPGGELSGERGERLGDPAAEPAMQRAVPVRAAALAARRSLMVGWRA